MATTAQRVFTPRIRNNQESSFEGTIDGVAYKANNFNLTMETYPDPIGDHWVARVHERSIDLTYKEITIYIRVGTADGSHRLDAQQPNILVSFIDYSEPQNPTAHKSVSGTIDFKLDQVAKSITGDLHAIMDNAGSDGSGTFAIDASTFLILGK